MTAQERSGIILSLKKSMRLVMKRSIVNLLLIICLSPFLVQCLATQKEIQSTNVKVYSIDNKVEDIDQEVQQLKGETVKEVQRRQAYVDDRLDKQQSELLKLKSQLEEHAHYNRLLREETKEMELGVSSRIDSIETTLNEKFNNKLTELNEKVEQLNEQLVIAKNQVTQAAEKIEQISQERAREAAERAREAAERAREAAKAASEAKAKAAIIHSDGSVVITPEKHKKIADEKPGPVTTEKKSEPAEDLYAEGLNLYKKEKFEQARETFSKYLEKYPNGRMAANARYWMGDCLYSQNEFELAILDYQRVIVDFPQHSKVPAALLKQGMAFEKLKDAETAKIVYQRVLDNYPKSDQVTLAKTRLEALK